MINKNIKVIQNLDTHFQKKNVCAYARVSSDKDLQLMSFEAQVNYYTNYILKNSDWNFVGVYADEGISGTSTRKRDQFNLMIELAAMGKIDLIITKSISRFSRNVIDTLSILKDLKASGTEVFFEKENISSYDPKIEFVISVLASMAEEESRIISDNVKWGVRSNFKKGEYYFQTSTLLGYKRDDAGNIYIDETEAEIVRGIYQMYLDGIGSTTIAKTLTERGIKTIRGNDKWNVSGVMGILKNEKYSGSAMLQKTVNLNFRHKNSVDNKNYLPKYYIEDSHEPIISKETFKAVQEKLNSKTTNQLNSFKGFINREHYTKYSGLCSCGYCGEKYRHKINNGNTPYQREMLLCTSNETKKLCQSSTLFINAFEKIVTNQINQMLLNQKELINIATQAFINDKRLVNLRIKKEACEAQIEALRLKAIDNDTLNDEFKDLVKNQLQNQINTLQVELSVINNQLLTEYNLDIKISAFKKLLKELKDLNGNYENFDYKRLFSNIIIYSRESIIFVLNLRSNIKYSNSAKTIFKCETTHLIRKTEIKTSHSLFI